MGKTSHSSSRTSTLKRTVDFRLAAVCYGAKPCKAEQQLVLCAHMIQLLQHRRGCFLRSGIVLQAMTAREAGDGSHDVYLSTLFSSMRRNSRKVGIRAGAYRTFKGSASISRSRSVASVNTLDVHRTSTAVAPTDEVLLAPTVHALPAALRSTLLSSAVARAWCASTTSHMLRMQPISCPVDTPFVHLQVEPAQRCTHTHVKPAYP